ncbi:MAG: ClpXP protease specificity-enhancing factor SspB, partial [Gallionellaceae bacterium]|nr:ClpXP protease specificity-enhancing factor SspB [Gallionellaceae bacterium]
AIIVPVAAVIGIFAKENGQGLAFQAHEDETPPAPPDNDGSDKPPPNEPAKGKPQLRVVK